MSHGILAVLSTPLIVADKPVGVLNLYARTAYAFEPLHRQLAGLLAGHAATAVIAALRMTVGMLGDGRGRGRRA